MVGRSTTRRTIRQEEAAAAWYLDFEGNVCRPPTLLGVLSPEWSRQWIVDPCFADLAVGRRRRTLPVLSLVELLALLRRRLLSEEGVVGAAPLVLAYSSHEQDVIAEYVEDRELAEWWIARITNAAPIARRWVNSGRAGIAPADGHTLAGCMRAIGYRVPAAHGPGRTGATLRRLRTRLERCDERGIPTPRESAAWTNLLAHNQHDIVGLREVMLAAAQPSFPVVAGA